MEEILRWNRVPFQDADTAEDLRTEKVLLQLPDREEELARTEAEERKRKREAERLAKDQAEAERAAKRPATRKGGNRK